VSHRRPYNESRRWTRRRARRSRFVAATADENARNTTEVSTSTARMEGDVARVREEALTLDATAERVRELVTRFRLEREAPVAEVEVRLLVLDPRLGHFIVRQIFVLRNRLRDAWLRHQTPQLHDVCDQSHDHDPPVAIVPRRANR
jgi:hypothetical protein